MLLIHPLVQAVGIPAALDPCATWVQRFRSAHLKQKLPFPWKRHGFAGRMAFAVLSFGFVIGLAMVAMLLFLNQAKPGIEVYRLFVGGL